MRRLAIVLLGLIFTTPLAAATKDTAAKPALNSCTALASPPERATPKSPEEPADAKPSGFTPGEVWSDGAVTVGGVKIAYCAAAGTLVVHPKGWDDAAAKEETPGKPAADGATKNPSAEASMFYVAYFRRDAAGGPRPITFLFNGGPGSASVWLHMGAFGPKRVETANARHSAPPPYRLVNNDQSLLDVSDLVFIDAPGTGFSRIAGEDKEKSFYGVDEDAHAFAEFITAFLSKYKRWNAPKYLFGESYGTTRAAVLVRRLQDDPGVDFNGIIMLSQVLAYNFYPDNPKTAPGNDLPYQLGLPTYAATAWYHNQPADKRSTDVPPALLAEVERFAMGEYAMAMAAGSSLDTATRDTIATKLSTYTGLSADYWRYADLRVGVDEFRQELLRGRGLIVGASDTRFSGHALDRMSKKAGHDPTDAAIASPYVSSFNDYTRRVLRYGEGKTYRPSVNDIGDQWSFRHQTPGGQESDPPFDRAVNVMLDLAHALKTNPLLKVQLNAGYFDLLTPYFQGKYETRHLPLPPDLRANIEYRCYHSGHMVYLTTEAREQLHDNVADFIERTANLPPRPARPRPGTPGCPATP